MLTFPLRCSLLLFLLGKEFSFRLIFDVASSAHREFSRLAVQPVLCEEARFVGK
jgi:hypothetical protein